MNLVHQFLKDLTMGTVGIINIAFGVMIFLYPASNPYIKMLAATLVVGGITLILMGRR